MRSTAETAAPTSAQGARRLWMPRQHGAWAMLALPIAVGIAASRFVPAQLLLVAAALGGYLLSATAQAWRRARRRAAFRPSLAVYGLVTIASGVPLLVLEPRLLLLAIILVPAGLLTFASAKPGTPRELVTSLAQVAEGVALVPAAMLVAGEQRPWPIVAATLVVAAEMAGSVLVVRSCIRERDNPRFAAGSVAFHAAVAVATAVALAPAYAGLGLFLAARAAALPIVRRRRAAAGRPIRPVHVGIVEAVCSLALVAVTIAVPIAPG